MNATTCSRTGAVILARLDSNRLPGKTLRPALGRPMLAYTIDRVRCVRTPDRRVPDIVLATSDRAVDDPLAEFAAECGIGLFRGSVADVAGRVAACAQLREWDAFLRINGDSPFVDPATLSCALGLLAGHTPMPPSHGALWQGETELAGTEGSNAPASPAYANAAPPDMVTNVLRRTFPKGLSVEACRTTAFLRGYAAMSRPEHHEHVTSYFYETRSVSLLNMLSRDHALGSIQLSVDTPDDFALFERMLARMDQPHTEYADYQILALYRECFA